MSSGFHPHDSEVQLCSVRSQGEINLALADDITDDVNKNKPVGEEEVDTGFKDLESSNAPNLYVGKRNFIHQLMDVALLMANVSQLKALLFSESNEYFYLLITFICLSISLQVIFTICMLAIWSIEKKLEGKNFEPNAVTEAENESRKVWADRLDRFGNVLVLFIIVSNVFITGFGVEGKHTESVNNGSTAGR